MKKLKEAWKGMTKREKTLIIVRDMACSCFLLVALLTTLGLVPHGTPIAWLLPLAAISQAALSWKCSKATALFFLVFLVFFLFVFLSAEDKMVVYNKLVRDKIPEMIRSNGETPNIRILADEEYLQHLEAKLDEEAGEFHRDKNMEELADILEVVFALAEGIGSKDELLEVYRKKYEARGGFRNRIFLISKE